MKQVGRDGVGELLIEKSREALRKVDLPTGARFLEPDYGVKAACAWVHFKFGIVLSPHDVAELEPAAFKAMVRRRAEEAYHEKEVVYPVMAGLYHFTTRDPGGHKHYDREELAASAGKRFEVDLDLEDLKNEQRDEIRDVLVEQSRRHGDSAKQAAEKVESQWAAVFNGEAPSAANPPRRRRRRTAGVALPLGRRRTPLLFVARGDAPPIAGRSEDPAPTGRRRTLSTGDAAIGAGVLLQILDNAWKNHLLTMDHLKSSIGLRGYAQVDPKVEYKREGMKTFEEMWHSVGGRVTDLVFRVEQLDEGFVGSTWKETEAVHEDASAAGGIAQQQQQAIDGTQSDHKPQPIRNRQQRVGRNDPCPCGSGKKFKHCHMRK